MGLGMLWFDIYQQSVTDNKFVLLAKAGAQPAGSGSSQSEPTGASTVPAHKYPLLCEDYFLLSLTLSDQPEGSICSVLQPKGAAAALGRLAAFNPGLLTVWITEVGGDRGQGWAGCVQEVPTLGV